MKILSVGNFLNPSWDGSLPDEEHIAGALEDLGHEVFRQQREDDAYNIPDNLDFVLYAQWDGYRYGNIQSVKAYTKVPTIYWAFDHQADGQEWHERLVAEADLYLSKRTADSKYPNWRWLSQDFAPSFLIDERHTKREEDKDIDVLFTGSYLPWATERNETLKAVDGKFDLQIHSYTADAWIAQGFKNVNGPIMDHGLPELYSRAKVNLSIDHTLEAGYWSDRNAQIMACGGFVLTRYIPLMETHFQNKVSYFHNIDQCLEGVQYFLDCSEDREYLARQGYEHARDNLMVENRVADLLTIVSQIL